MIFKLSYKNLKKSIHDYSIYFITLTIAVALNYIFNLLPYQPFMKVFTSEASSDIGALLMQMSLPIAFIVSGLALYSNNFLLKRRSREIGIYLMLGTKYWHIHLMMIFETLLIGIGSFIAGCGLGMALARFFDLLIVRLLGLTINESSVLFAFPALMKTVICFMIIFIIIAVFNYFVISKARLIDIVKSRGESLKNKRVKNNILVQSLLFVVSIIEIVYFYYILSRPNVDFTDALTMISLVIGFMGHILMFISGAGIISYLVSKNKRNLYKDTNLFTLKQITHKISKNGIMLGIISFIMALTMIMMNMGVSSHLWVNENLKYTAPYSVSVTGIQPNVPTDEVVKYVESKGYTIEEVASYNMYFSEYKLKDFYNSKKTNLLSQEYYYSSDSSVKILKLSDYNRIREILGFETVSLEGNQAALSISKDIILAFSHKENINIGGYNLSISADSVYTDPVSDTKGVAGYGVAIVVPDHILDNSMTELAYDISLVINTEEKIPGKSGSEILKGVYNVISNYNGGHGVIVQSETRENNLKQASIIIFTGLFVGLILLIVGASILSLQQMTEITENKSGYEIIKKLGVTDKKVNKTIFKQIKTYFMIPLTVASVHSVFGTIGMSSYTHINVDNSILVYSIIGSLCIFLTVYLGYILFTYSRCKKFIEE